MTIYDPIMKPILLFLSMILPVFAMSQVTFRLDSIPDYTPPDSNIYIAGSFNNWDPGDANYKLSKDAFGTWWITMPARTEGTVIQFKFTLGDWGTVEKGANMEELNNRIFTYGNGDTVGVIILNWAQGGGGGSTAAENVSIIDDSFEMPQLNRTRRIWLYLPPDYETSGKNYPVLYMHDGQNLFDAQTSFAGEWNVDETLNDLFTQGYNVPIVVGIDNGGGERINEYSPWAHVGYGGGDGDLYMQFIVETLKPYIDSHYRTMTDRDATGIMGSSMGGFISHYGAVQYQQIFGKAGIFSPSYWFSDSIFIVTRLNGVGDGLRFYLMCGGSEGQGTINDLYAMRDTLLAVGYPENDVYSTVIPGGQHNENLWRQDFGNAYLWLFGSYASGIQKPPETRNILPYPNPAGDKLHLPDNCPKQCDSLIIMDMEGRTVIKKQGFTGRNVDVSRLSPGIYIISLTSQGKYYQGKFAKE